MRPLRCGDVYWLDHDDGRAINPPYSHPHVVTAIHSSADNGAASVVVCTLTTNLAAAAEPGNIVLDKGEAGLLRQSVIVVSRRSTVSAERLRGFIGSLSEDRVQQILSGSEFLERWFSPRSGT